MKRNAVFGAGALLALSCAGPAMAQSGTVPGTGAGTIPSGSAGATLPNAGGGTGSAFGSGGAMGSAGGYAPGSTANQTGSTASGMGLIPPESAPRGMGGAGGGAVPGVR